MTGRRGFALLVVLWSVALLALLGAGLTATARQSATMSRLGEAAIRAEALADGLVWEAVLRLLDPSSRGWRPDGVRRQVRLGNGVGSVEVLDHAGRLNPSVVGPQLLAALLRRLGENETSAARVAAAIVDWRSNSQVASPGGAKRAEYLAAGRDFAPPNQGFRTPGELALVLGMTPDLLARLLPHVSVWNNGRIDPMRADPLVVQALRDSGTRLPPPSGDSSPDAPMLVEIVAMVHLRDAQAERHAVLRLDAQNADAPHPWQVLAWD